MPQVSEERMKALVKSNTLDWVSRTNPPTHTHALALALALAPLLLLRGVPVRIVTGNSICVHRLRRLSAAEYG